MPDEELVCRDCGSRFLFTEAERQFFQTQGFTNPPKRCKACRARARARSRRGVQESPARVREAPRTALRESRQEPPEPRPPKPRGPLHSAVCSVCGETTEVPFVPDGVRPVFCLPCLKRQTR